MKRRLKCLLIDLGWRLVPAPSFRSWLLRKHLDHCPACQDQLASAEEARSLLLPDAVPCPEGMLTRAEELIASEEIEAAVSSSRRAPHWLALARYLRLAVVALVILMAGFVWYLARQEARFQLKSVNDTFKTKNVSIVSLDYVRTKGKPATTYIYRTENPEMVIIWVEAVN